MIRKRTTPSTTGYEVTVVEVHLAHVMVQARPASPHEWLAPSNPDDLP